MNPWNRELRFPRRLPAALLLAAPLLAAEEAEAPGRNGTHRGMVPSAVVEVTAPLPPEPFLSCLELRSVPLPAPDGAEALRALPGFQVIRKGGTDGDPVLRGMAGSRLAVRVDGEETPGGCGGRMDPPTAYLFPSAWDRIQVLKGPQTVLWGPGNSAGTVLFQRRPRRWEQPGWSAEAHGLTGGFGRSERVLELQGGTPRWYLRGTGIRSQCEDYRCGDGALVHSGYSRWSASGALGWTPSERTRMELRGARSDGQAAYADRGMDGVSFLRRNAGIAWETRELSPRVEKLEFQAYVNEIDHVMDNGSLRDFIPSPGALGPMARNPRRSTRGGRAAVTLRPEERSGWVLGADLGISRHDLRRSMNLWEAPLKGQPRIADAALSSFGLFGEWTRILGGGDHLVAGLRADRWQAEDLRATLSAGPMANIANPTAQARREQLLVGGFARWEWALGRSGAGAFAGLGHAARPPDYWELFPVEAADSPSAFLTRPERTTQLDFGATWQEGAIQASLSGFYGWVQDFILIQSGFPKPGPAGSAGPRGASIARNIQASTWGGEAALSAALAGPWRVDASLAYAWGANRTDAKPLAQMTPLEGRLGLSFETPVWSTGSRVRMVAPQNRFALNQGTIAGQDLGRTPGFAVFALDAGWRPGKGLQLRCGVDNLFDRAYAEPISRNASAIPGYLSPGVRIQEPGRMAWIRIDLSLP